MNTSIKKIITVIALFAMQLGLIAQNKIVFSSKPFWDGGTEQKEFKAGSPIYGRIILDYAVKKYCSNKDQQLYINDKIYSVKFSLYVKENGQGEEGVSFYLTKEQLENKFIDFDISPEKEKATTIYQDPFKFYITSGVDLSKGITCFDVEVDKNSLTETGITGLSATNKLCIDYSGWDQSKIEVWQKNMEEAKVAAVNNAAKVGSKFKMVFSSKPFAKGGTEQTEFKVGTPIYGRILLPKALKEYNANPTKKSDNVPSGFFKSIALLPVNGGDFDEPGFPSDFTMFLTAADLEKNYIDFDVMPTEQDAKSPYDWDMAFYRAYANTMHADTRKKHFAIKNQQISGNSSFTDIDVQGDFYIEYDGSTSTALETWANTCEKAHKAAKANASKNGIAEGAEMVKKLPLPNVFNKPSSPGYKSYSSAVITQMIKSYLKVSEVYMLCYGPNKELTEFEVRKDDYNMPISKTGNLYFYFIFKDTDGFYKASGAYLIQPYQGGGKYGAAYMRLEGCITEGDASYPLDVIREKNGFNYIIVVDGAKVKKQ